MNVFLFPLSHLRRNITDEDNVKKTRRRRVSSFVSDYFVSNVNVTQKLKLVHIILKIFLRDTGCSEMRLKTFSACCDEREIFPLSNWTRKHCHCFQRYCAEKSLLETPNSHFSGSLISNAEEISTKYNITLT